MVDHSAQLQKTSLPNADVAQGLQMKGEFELMWSTHAINYLYSKVVTVPA